MSETPSHPAETEHLDRLAEVSRRRTIINAAANYSKYGVALLVNLFLQAYIIRTLGKVEYSLWPLVSTVTGFIALIPVGIGAGTGRFLAHALGRKDLRDVEEITTSVFAALLVAAGVYAVAVVAFSLTFERIFDIPPGAAGIGPWAMLLAGLAGAIRIPFGVFQGGLNAAQQYVAINLREIGLLILRGILTVLVFTVSGPSLIWVAAVFLLIEGVSAVVTWYVARRIVPWQRIRWKSFNWKTLWKVSSFSAWVLVATAAGLLYWKTDNIVINKLLDPILLTGYSVVVTFVLQAYSLASLGSSVLVPATTVLHAKGDINRITRLIYHANRITVPLAAPILMFTILFGSELLSLYLGPQYASYAVLFPILAGAGIISCTQVCSGCVPQAFGRPAIMTMGAVFWALLNVAISIVLVLLGWGLVGVAAGTAIVIILGRGFWQPWYIARMLKVRWLEYYVEDVLVPLAHCLPVGIMMAVLRTLGLGKDWAGLLLVLAVSGLVHGLYMFIYGLPKADRQWIRQTLARLARISPRITR